MQPLYGCCRAPRVCLETKVKRKERKMRETDEGKKVLPIGGASVSGVSCRTVIGFDTPPIDSVEWTTDHRPAFYFLRFCGLIQSTIRPGRCCPLAPRASVCNTMTAMSADSTLQIFTCRCKSRAEENGKFSSPSTPRLPDLSRALDFEIARDSDFLLLRTENI